MDEESTTGAKAAGILRRLAALFYDALLLVALLFVATLAVLPFTHGEAITTSGQGPMAYAYRVWLLLMAFAYFGFSWARGGQTLGMRAWGLRLETGIGGMPGWRDAVLRFATGMAATVIAGLGLWFLRRPGWPAGDAGAVLMLLPAILNFAWVVFDRLGRSLQDFAGRLRVVRIR